jgi:hypothetical protein
LNGGYRIYPTIIWTCRKKGVNDWIDCFVIKLFIIKNGKNGKKWKKWKNIDKKE